MKLAAVWFPVSQWEAAKAFYGEVLELVETSADDRAGWAAFNSGSLPFFLIRRPELAGGMGGGVATFRVDDLGGAARAADDGRGAGGGAIAAQREFADHDVL